MSAVSILVVIFTSIIAIVWIVEREQTKRERNKIEETLRSEEMMRGYKAGTYNLSEEKEEDLPENLKRVRDRLEDGFLDLKDRIKTISGK
ncbi:MAG: hypothetical protein MSA93_09305 [Spirochaetales bacterium]|nr:hypothetical protein [Spirochaetales bacterium]